MSFIYQFGRMLSHPLNTVKQIVGRLNLLLLDLGNTTSNGSN